jgi:uncharacterized protein YndB with AHSA1/START domain
MTALTTTTDTNRSAEAVFDYVTDPRRFHEWQEGVVDGHIEGPGPHHAGDRCVTTRRIGGAQRKVTSEITHIEPPTTWGVQGIDGPIRAKVDVVTTALNGDHRTRVTIALQFTGHGIGKLLIPFVRRSARREMPANLARLKGRLENPGSDRPSNGVPRRPGLARGDAHPKYGF